jgi:hypothetical protein
MWVPSRQSSTTLQASPQQLNTYVDAFHDFAVPKVFPIDIWFLLFDLLFTRDIITLSLSCRYVYAVAEDERKKRWNINKLLSVFVNDVDTFQLLMHETGGVLVGQLAENLFTRPLSETRTGNKVELFSPEMNFVSTLRSWFCFLIGESGVLGQTLYMTSYEDERVFLCI